MFQRRLLLLLSISDVVLCGFPPALLFSLDADVSLRIRDILEAEMSVSVTRVVCRMPERLPTIVDKRLNGKSNKREIRKNMSAAAAAAVVENMEIY